MYKKSVEFEYELPFLDEVIYVTATGEVIPSEADRPATLRNFSYTTSPPVLLSKAELAAIEDVCVDKLYGAE